MLKAIGVALSGLRLQAKRAEVASENIANSQSASSRDGTRGAYRAQDVVATSGYASVRGQVRDRDPATVRVPVQSIDDFIAQRLPAATTRVGIGANLPADAAAGFTATAAFDVYDALGAAHTVTQTFTKLPGANQWRIDFSNPALSADPSIASGSVSPASVDVTFDGAGNLQGVSTYPLTVTLSGLVTGSSNVSFSLDLGTIGSTDGLTQFASSAAPPAVEVYSVSQNGYPFGARVAGDDAGIDYVEFPNVNLDEELVTLAQAEQGYAANAQTIATSKRMFDALLDALRG